MKRKLIAALGAAALAVCLLLGSLIWSGYRESIHVAEETTRGYAATVAAKLDATLRRIEGDLRYGAGNLPVAALNRAAVPLFAPVINANLDRRKAGFPDLGGMRVFAADGELLYTSDRQTVPHFSAAALPHFRQARETPDLLVISDVVIGQVSGKADVVFVKAVRDQQGVFLGAVAASLNLSHFQGLIKALNTSSQGVVSVYRSDNFKLAIRQPWGSEKPGNILPEGSRLRQSIAAGKPATLDFVDPVDGVRRIYAHQALEGYPFVLVAGVSRDAVLASWFHQALVVAASVVTLLVLIFVLLWRLLRTEGIRTLQAAIIDNASDAIITRNQELRIMSWNAAAERLFGFSATEAIGQNIAIFVPPGREAEIARNRQLLGEGRPVLDLETVRRTKDGRLIDVSLSQSPITDDAGNVTGAALSFRDISGRKLAEKALRSSEEKFATAFRASPMFMSISTLYDGRYIDVSEGFLQFTGHAREDVIGRTSRDIGLWKTFENRQRAIEDLSRHGRVSAFEAELCNISGAARVCEVWGDPIDIDDVPCVLWVVHDVTARKNAEAARAALEAQLRESQKMEAIGTLAGGIAHDFNNIIATILGNATLARDDVRDRPADALESINEIDKAGKRARDLVQQILSFSRREPTRRKPTPLAGVIEESARLLRSTLPARVAVEIVCAADVPDGMVDATQMEQVLINLATNAAQAMRDAPGRIVFELDCVPIDQELALANPDVGALAQKVAGPALRLVVRDDGPGMHEHVLQRIFEPFFTTKPVGEGTGLGLSVVHGIIRTHEGAILVASALGEGSTFTIYLPPASTANPGVT